MREAGARSAQLSVEGEVVQAGDAEHGVVNAVAFEAAVAEDLPALHAGEGVLDAGANSLVGAVVFLLPRREFLAFGAAVRDDESGAMVIVLPTASLAPDSPSRGSRACCRAEGGPPRRPGGCRRR